MSLGRQILGHTAVYSLSAILARAVSLIFLPFYAQIFHTEGYGVIGMIDASIGILAIAFGAGFHLAILRVYHAVETARKMTVVTTAIVLAWGLGALAVALPLLFSGSLSTLVLGAERYQAIVVLALVQFVIEVAGQSASTLLIIEQRSRLYAGVNLVRLAIGVALNVWLVLILDVGLIGVFVTSLVAAVAGSVLFHAAVLRRVPLRFDREIARRLLSFHLPMLPGEIVAFVGRQAERVLVNFMIGLRGVGVLEMAYKFPPLLNLFFSIPFHQAWRTKSIELAEHDADAPRIIGHMFTSYMFLMTFCGLALAVTIDDLLRILTPPEFWPATPIARIEIVTTILAGANGLLMFGLLYRNRTGTISAIKSGVAVVKLPLAFLMITLYQLSGAAWSALAAEVVLTLVLFERSQRLYRVDYEYDKLLLIAAYGMLVYVVVAEFGASRLLPADVAAQGVTTGAGAGSEAGAATWLRVLEDRRTDLLVLVADLASTVLFLAAAPLVVGRRGVSPTAAVAEGTAKRRLLAAWRR